MFLADTNLLSEPRQKNPDVRVLKWLSDHEEELLISAISLAEIQSGISLLADGRKKSALREWYDVLRENHRGSILDFNEAVALRWGDLDAELERKGKKMPMEDSYLAATALHYDLTVATRNERDFREATVKVLNPWKENS